jgi:hypothetical protein
MNLGMKIRLMDYTTSIWVDRKGSAHPCIFVEKMMANLKAVVENKGMGNKCTVLANDNLINQMKDHPFGQSQARTNMLFTLLSLS